MKKHVRHLPDLPDLPRIYPDLVDLPRTFPNLPDLPEFTGSNAEFEIAGAYKKKACSTYVDHFWTRHDAILNRMNLGPGISCTTLSASHHRDHTCTLFEVT